jgi:RNA polymerase sigma-70 factor, ECF subfamily
LNWFLHNIANTLPMGLGIKPDFDPPAVFQENKVHLSAAESRPTGMGVIVHEPRGRQDRDGGLVAQAQEGNLEAFEELVRCHSKSIYRTVTAILGDPNDAQDSMQDALLSAFKHIGRFQGHSTFSTWLVSIARNTAIQRLRGRRNLASLDEGDCEEDGEFRPRQVRDCKDNPEQCYSKSEIRQLVRRGVLELPAKCRVVVTLRDIEQLSTNEVAHQLNLSVSAVKARLVRGRLKLREWLSPHFAMSVGRTVE